MESRLVSTKRKWISWIEKFKRSIFDPNNGLVQAVLLPFIVTRLIWLAVGLFAVNFVSNPTYPQYSQRGWFLSPHFLIDMWCRWDSKWYLSIVEGGYQAPADLTHTISNIAFFPLYPGLVKAFTWILPGAIVSRSLILLIGLLLSNLCFLVGAVLLFRFIQRNFNPDTAQRTLFFYFAFPSSFIFSAFYPESLFFLLGIAAFLLAFQSRWLLSCVLASFLALTRPQGILMTVPMIFMYFEHKKWQIRQVKADLLSFSLPFAALLWHLHNLYPLTADFLSPLLAQKAWGRLGADFLSNVWLQISAPLWDVFKLDLFFLLLFLVISVFILVKWPFKAMGIYSLLLILMPMFTGSVVSVTRFVLLSFPVFIYAGEKLKSRAFNITWVGLFTFQVLYFLGWVNYYWTI